jgi:hypothetical protein
MQRMIFLALAIPGLLGLPLLAYPPDSVPQGIEAAVETVQLEYEGRMVSARRLRVRSLLPLSVDSAWAWVQTPALLEHVARGRVRFLPENETFPLRWFAGDSVGTRMRLYGFLPIGGVHWLYIETVDQARRRIETREWDRTVQVWNHTITLEPLGPKQTLYTDEIVLYARWRTGLIAWWAKGFYRHRQKRWQKLQPGDGLKFTSLNL